MYMFISASPIKSKVNKRQHVAYTVGLLVEVHRKLRKHKQACLLFFSYPLTRSLAVLQHTL